MKRILFVLLAGALAGVFWVAVARDMAREWTGYQRRFLGTLARSERGRVKTGIQQLLVPDLHRVDRCTTCHLAIDTPQLALGEEPFTAHPGKFLEWHPVEKYGCTICHGGQGLATETKAAHGDVPHWEEPLLRGPLIQAACAKCHGDLQPIMPQAPLLAQGRALFKAKGCYGCHAIRDFGQTVSQDLTAVGSKSYQLMEADFEMMPTPHDRIHWMMRKLANPRRLNPGARDAQLPPGEEEVYPSAMPHFGLSPEEIQAITVYLLSLTDEDLPASFVTPAKPEPAQTFASAVDRGQAVFEKYGCAACHGRGGVGGRRNWNAGLGEEIPSLLYVRAYYGHEVESLKTLIRNGRQPTPRASADRPNPSLYMPAWKERLSNENLDALIAYLFSLAERLPRPEMPAPRADTAAAGPGGEPAAPAVPAVPAPAAPASQ